MDQTTIERFRRARHDRDLAVLEGIHPLKHALRFGADVTDIVGPDPGAVLRLAGDLAPDVADAVADRFVVVAEETFEELAPRPPASGVLALARRPIVDLRGALASREPAPIVLLEGPTHLGNIGAVVRVAAAAGAAAVITTGRHDPWHPVALRGSAGLHFALPVGRIDFTRVAAPGELPVLDGGALPTFRRPLLALDPEGEALTEGLIPSRALLAFGTESGGLSETLLEAADRRVRIPMRPGVSSLNLATAVAVCLYAAGTLGTGGSARGF